MIQPHSCQILDPLTSVPIIPQCHIRCKQPCSGIRLSSLPVNSPPHPCQNPSPSACPSRTIKTCCTHCKPQCSLLDPLPPPKIQHIEQLNTRMPSGECPNQNLLSIQTYTKSQPYPAFKVEPTPPAPCSMPMPSLHPIYSRRVLYLRNSESTQHLSLPSLHCNSFFYAQQPMPLCCDIIHVRQSLLRMRKKYYGQFTHHYQDAGYVALNAQV